MVKEDIKILITGDFSPRLRVNEAIEKGDYECLFGDLIDNIREADIAITNLEAPLCNTPSPTRKTGPNLMAPTKSIEALKYAGFGLVTLANNHIMDQGAAGFESTIETCKKAGIDYLGAGMNFEEAKQVKVIECKEKKIAFINCCENEWSTTTGEEPGTNPLNEVNLYYQIEEAKSKADYTILIIHGGHETYELPSPRMKKLYHWFIDLGVDAVIGHHTHCYCGREEYKGKPIVYSLGNFVFDMDGMNPSWNRGAAVLLSINNDGINIHIVPFTQCLDVAGVRKMLNLEYKKWLNRDAELNSIIVNDRLLLQEFNDFIKRQTSQYDNYMEPNRFRIIRFLRKRGIWPKLITGRTAFLYTNIIRNESHRDIVLSLLNNKCYE